MKTLSKFIVFITISSVILFGCITTKNKTNNDNYPTYYNSSTNIVVQTCFNEEVYVWEQFNFSTNRVIDTK